MIKRMIAALKNGWLLTAILVCLPVSAGAQTVPDWSLGIAGTAGSTVAHDRDSNVYAIGSVLGTSILLTKINSTGLQQWQRTFDSPGIISRGAWVTVDASGNALVAGATVNTSGIATGLVVLKYDPAGTLLWQDVIPSPLGQATRVKTDASGNVYVLGLLANAAGTGRDLAVLKYSSIGARLWIKTVAANAISADVMGFTPSGSVVVVGHSSGQLIAATVDPAGNQTGLKFIAASDGSTDLAIGSAGEIYVIGSVGALTTGGYLVVKHDANLIELWRNVYPARGLASRAAIDAAGNLVVTGAVDTNTGLLTVVLYDWLTIKIDSNGTLLWSRILSENNSEIPYAMAMASDSSILITGEGRALVVDAAGSFYLPSTLTVKYASDGTQMWSANAPAPSIQVPSVLRGIGMDLGIDGSVLVMGQYPQTIFRYPQSGLPNVAPVALASAFPSTGLAPLTTSFSSAASTDPYGRISTYVWDFGDGQTSTVANPTHIYAAGTYSARLTVTDSLGASTTSAPLAITSTAQLPVQPTALILTSSSVAGGNSTTATVTVSGKAGVTLLLSSSNTAVASVPASVTIPVGATTARFTVRTSRVKRNTVVNISATANGATANTALTVRLR